MDIDVKPARSLPTPESKALDISLSATAYNTNNQGTLLLLNGCVTGNDLNNRDGRKIRIESVMMRISCTMPLNTNSNGFGTRTILFFDKQPNAAAPAITDLLVADTPTSNLNLNNRDRFIVLMDKVRSTIGSSGYNDFWKKYKNLYFKNLDTIYNGVNGGTVADITSGSLYLLTFMQGITTTNVLTCAGDIRVRFTDL